MIFIDILKEKYKAFPKYGRFIHKNDFNENCYNLLKYINIKYGIKVEHLAKIFNLSRQSVYNYFKTPTDKLPRMIIDKIVHIYGFHNFEEVLNVELILNFSGFYRDEIEAEIEEGVKFNDIKHHYKYLFKPNPPKYFEYISLKDEYNYEINWRKSYAGLLILPYISIDLYINFRRFLSKHSSIYIDTLFKTLNEVNENDYEIVRILENYLSSKRRNNAKY